MDDSLKNSYEQYFNKTTIKKDNEETKNDQVDQIDKEDDKEKINIDIENKNFSEGQYTYKNHKDGIPIESTLDYGDTPHSWLAEGNVSTIDELGNIIKKLLNAAWGNDWGIFGSSFKEGKDENNLILPQIIFDEHEREITENTAIKPKLINTFKEIDQNGKPTGDTFKVYKQWFDAMVEFNIYGKTKKETREMVNKFEMLIGVYMKHLKKKGISEMIFLKYVTESKSEQYNENSESHMGSLLYLVRLERTTKVKTSTLNKLEMEVNKSN